MILLSNMAQFNHMTELWIMVSCPNRVEPPKSWSYLNRSIVMLLQPKPQTIIWTEERRDGRLRQGNGAITKGKWFILFLFWPVGLTTSTHMLSSLPVRVVEDQPVSTGKHHGEGDRKRKGGRRGNWSWVSCSPFICLLSMYESHNLNPHAFFFSSS